MNTQEMIRMKGAVTCVERVEKTVRLWVNAPTGDSSDSNIFIMTCHSEAQAKIISAMWREVWGL
jgi:hypothetical protein